MQGTLSGKRKYRQNMAKCETAHNRITATTNRKSLQVTD